MICYVLAMGKQQLGPHVVVGYGIKIFWPGLFITSPDHLEKLRTVGDKSQKRFATESTLNFSGPYKLTNHSACTNQEI